MVRMAKCPTKIRVYGSKGMTNRNVGVRLARKRSKVRLVGRKFSMPLKAVYILSVCSKIMLAGLKD